MVSWGSPRVQVIPDTAYPSRWWPLRKASKDDSHIDGRIITDDSDIDGHSSSENSDIEEHDVTSMAHREPD